MVADSAGNLLVTNSVNAATGQGTVTFSVDALTDGTATTGNVAVQFYDASGDYVSGSTSVSVATGVTTWQTLSGSVTVPANATQYQFWMNVQNGETTWFDNISVTAPAPAPASAPVPRRTAYRDMLYDSREYWRQNTRHYTNQNQYTALGIYQCNRGLSLLSPSDAWDQSTAAEWIYQAVGLSPFSGSRDEAGTPSWILGHDYYVVTPKGLSRELGYV